MKAVGDMSRFTVILRMKNKLPDLNTRFFHYFDLQSIYDELCSALSLKIQVFPIKGYGKRKTVT